MQKDKLLKQVGRQIIRLRREQNMSQSDLARACDKDPQSIERVENGKVNPSVYYLMEIARGLKVPLKELFDFDT